MMNRPVFTLLLAATTASFLPGGCARHSATQQASPQAMPTGEPIEVVQSPISKDSYGTRPEGADIDTIVIHYASAIYWFDPSFQKLLTPELNAYAESISLTPESLPQHKYDWQLVKAIFDAYNVSAHYAIARDGTIVQLVPDEERAWHAGRSTMPGDGRTGVNDFSIGIELMASHPDDDPTVLTPEDAYTEAQYESLNQLIKKLCERHGIEYVVGHDEIAPGRKTDPGPLFQWNRVRTDRYAPKACEPSAD